MDIPSTDKTSKTPVAIAKGKKILKDNESFQGVREGFIHEEEISGDAADRVHMLLTHPSPNPQKERLIKKAMKRFPHPGEPVKIDLDA